jgi:nickel/cobalt exporter
MPAFNEYLAQGHGWLFFPMAILLGALHGLEPGHSKTMMTAFIVAIRGTIWQAFLLGVSATISHTAIIWMLAFIGLHYAENLNVEELEPYFQLATGIVVIGLAAWMLYRIRQAQKEAHHEHGDSTHGGTMINTGHGWIEISVFETDVPPRFRLYFYDEKKNSILPSKHQTVTLETIRPDKSRQRFDFLHQENYLEASEHLPEPHEFQAILELKHGDHGHTFKVQFVEHHHHNVELVGDIEFGDAHERAHAAEMQKQLMNQQVTTWQIILFGLTGGLLPCPSAFAVLLVCLQLKKVALGFALVLGFSIGLAITLVTVGVFAAVSVKHASKRYKKFGEFARKVPYASSTILILIGLMIAIQGLRHLLK